MRLEGTDACPLFGQPRRCRSACRGTWSCRHRRRLQKATEGVCGETAILAGKRDGQRAHPCCSVCSPALFVDLCVALLTLAFCLCFCTLHESAPVWADQLCRPPGVLCTPLLRLWLLLLSGPQATFRPSFFVGSCFMAHDLCLVVDCTMFPLRTHLFQKCRQCWAHIFSSRRSPLQACFEELGGAFGVSGTHALTWITQGTVALGVTCSDLA